MPYIIDLAHAESKQIIGSVEGYPQCLFDSAQPLTLTDVAQMQSRYLERLKGTGLVQDGTKWVVDKMPHNALFLGLISVLFPRSPIIHISRHPLDSCLSSYFSNFTGHRYTSSIESTATHYQHMMDCIEHYKSVLEMRFTEIRYQDLVDDQEANRSGSAGVIGAEWDDNCMQHHKAKRLVQTASYEQVTQKVYRTSLARYLGYWEDLEAVVPLVKPTIERLGYSLKE